MKIVHVVIPDLFLPQEVVADACAELHLPALEKLLACSQLEHLRIDTLEAWLCEAFGVSDQAIAAVTLRADGIEPGNDYWLRADPVYLRIQREQLILQPDEFLSVDEAAQLCAALNAHFADEGLRFFAPHPQRWYLQLDVAPDMLTRPLAQVAGKSVHAHLSQGQDALRWHGVLNEIQMLFYEHAVNRAREARGELPINSVWLWGGGRAGKQLLRPFARMYGDSVPLIRYGEASTPFALSLSKGSGQASTSSARTDFKHDRVESIIEAFAQVAGIPCATLPDDVLDCLDSESGDVLLVWEGLHRAIQHGDLHAWRTSLQHFEQCCAAPLLGALRTGRIAQITLDALNNRVASRFVLTRSAAWKLWRRTRRLTHYALV